MDTSQHSRSKKKSKEFVKLKKNSVKNKLKKIKIVKLKNKEFVKLQKKNLTHFLKFFISIAGTVHHTVLIVVSFFLRSP